ncbi:hypothetical protein BDY21DRAFT_363818 [Lineolata rhizophorae]|uniref:Uncharacterized protein n=1 Tax=Lineolata rhizophorae TaxID=578093 RepID=A0A6A6P151_9PEZI|nr:hypothetical protein BDY21DRAFT_363818 [Lineolata rhizophorae]
MDTQGKGQDGSSKSTNSELDRKEADDSHKDGRPVPRGTSKDHADSHENVLSKVSTSVVEEAQSKSVDEDVRECGDRQGLEMAVGAALDSPGFRALDAAEMSQMATVRATNDAGVAKGNGDEYDATATSNIDEGVPDKQGQEHGHTIKDAAAELVDTAIEKVKEAGSAIAGSASSASKSLGDKVNDGGLGPYEGLESCVPNDLDPLAAAVHSGVDLQESGSAARREDGSGKDSAVGNGTKEA